MEVTFPQDVIDAYAGMMPIGIMKKLLEQFIANTDSKEGKVMREFVFNDVKSYEWKENVGAYSFEFINERNRKTYITARQPFAEWLKGKNVITSYEISHDIPLNSVDILLDDVNGGFDNKYYAMAKKFVFIDIPESRGFVSETVPA